MDYPNSEVSFSNFKLNKYRLVLSVSFLLILLSACDSHSNSKIDEMQNSNSSSNQIGVDISWTNDNSLTKAISNVLNQNCPAFSASTKGFEFKLEAFSSKDHYKVFSIDRIEMWLYEDGEFGPDVQNDETSTATYYDKWKCKDDILFIDELRNIEGNPSVFVSLCGYDYSKKPKGISLACADGGIYLDAITWTSWNQMEASGSGTLVENTCNPDCASGNFVKQKAQISLGQVVLDKNRKLVFASAGVMTENKQVSGAYVNTFELEYLRAKGGKSSPKPEFGTD